MHNNARPRKQSVHGGDENESDTKQLGKIQRPREKSNLQSASRSPRIQLLNSVFLQTKNHGIIPASAESFLGETACQWDDQTRSSYGSKKPKPHKQGVPLDQKNETRSDRDNPMMLPRICVNLEIGERGSTEGDGVRIAGAGAAGVGAGAWIGDGCGVGRPNPDANPGGTSRPDGLKSVCCCSWSSSRSSTVREG